MTTAEMHAALRAQLAIDMNCAPDDFDRDGILFFETRDNPGRRPFPRGERVFEILTLGKAIVVTATPDILPFLRDQLRDRFRDDAFSLPFVFGQAMYYLPDLARMPVIALPDGFTLELCEKEDMPRVYAHEGFRNAVSYDLNHPRPDMVALIAKDGDTVVGMAGVSADCARLWQIGIDVLPAYRGQGIATALVSELTRETLRRGFIPYYGTSSANIPSQRVAHRAGYEIAWTCSYQGRFMDGDAQQVG